MSASLILTSLEPMQFKVDEEYINNYNAFKLPAFLEKNMVLTLVSGKWPLGDYNDCNGKHIFKFTKPDGTEISLYLQGFTWDCSESKIKQQKLMNEGHLPRLSVSDGKTRSVEK